MAHSHKHTSNNSQRSFPIGKILLQCTSQIEASTSPPRQPPGHLNFLENVCANPPFLGQKAVQMPHHRSLSGDQTPPPPGKLPDYCFLYKFIYSKMI